MDSTAQNRDGAANIPPNLAPKAPAKRNRAALLLAPAASTVAVVLMLLRLHFEPPAVPAYSVRPAAPAAGIVLRRGGSFAVDLHPDSPVVGAVAARGFLLQGESVHPWDPPFSVDVDGEVRIAGSVAALFAGVPDGAWEVAVAVGRPEMLPTAPRDVLRARGGTSPDTWHLAWERVELRPDGP
jgi:hypothetical protein